VTEDERDERDDLAALRQRIEARLTVALLAVEDANDALAAVREELAELPGPGVRLYASGSLTTQEMVVLRLLANGRTTVQIAADLFIAQSTARNHLSSIMTKLQAHTRLDAVRIAQRDGLL
jgi:two-component system response regulator DesR